ncbi:MAG: hypothetical protein NVSMB21_12820 [Vulcanimicrobiaceae bacterium]
MSASRRFHRLALVRRGRRYSACGIGAYRACGTHAVARARARGWLGGRAALVPGATLALIALFSAFVLGYPPSPPANPQQRAPIVGVARYTFADFAGAMR